MLWLLKNSTGLFVPDKKETTFINLIQQIYGLYNGNSSLYNKLIFKYILDGI